MYKAGTGYCFRVVSAGQVISKGDYSIVTEQAAQLGNSGMESWTTQLHHYKTKEIPAGFPYTYITKDELVHTPDFFDFNTKLNYTFVLNEHLKLQVNGGVQNIFNAFQKDLDKGTYRDSGYFYGPTQPRTYFIGIKLFN
mgnify:CR=1 FL=1